MSDNAAIYTEARERIGDLARQLRPEQLAATVPACPDWTVADLVAHVTGIAADVQAGRVEGTGSEAWTGAQVSRRRGAPVEDVLDEWAEAAAAIEATMFGGMLPAHVGEGLIGDLAVHEADMRNALQVPQARDADSTRLALRFYLFRLGRRIEKAGLPPLRVVAGGTDTVAGGEEAQATVRADPFDMFRAITGRRTVDQIRAFEWDGDPEPYLAHFSQYGTRTEPLDE